ncbi:hypothetical protein [Tessaracoccus caeni]|uniref:hypothetical protein n=1 Tax=Tessaracoccus caeni TaxID=3031239 RepID=UPI0023DB4C49|nr:hypothetical protein [Tessaracoccus caeni]MDF1489872.1 hypothetical protein [Tessaracoccus caeni]
MSESRGGLEQQRVLRFWWMLELLNPQPLPPRTKEGSSSADERIIEWRPGQLLPWQSLAAPKPLGGARRVWRHTVYLGAYRQDDARRRLREIFGADARDGRRGGESACAGVLVDHEGRLVAGSAVLSSELWALTRITHPTQPDPRWQEAFPRATQDFADAVDRYQGFRRAVAGTAQPRQPAQDPVSMRELVRIAHESAGVAGMATLATTRIVIKSVAIPALQADVPATDFLNSPYLDDLSAVRRHIVVRGAPGAALGAYLVDDAALEAHDRVDVVASPRTVDAGVTIERLPKGRWPSDPTCAAVLSEQFVVNKALDHLDELPGLIGVHTSEPAGGTALLRDILAGNIVERARRLASLLVPDDAFTSTVHRWNARDGRQHVVRALRPELTGFEMLAVSATDRDARHTAAQLVDSEQIDERWRDGCGYLPDIAAAVSGRARQDASAVDQPWVLVAATLGDKRHRESFWHRFWGDDEPLGQPGMASRLERRSSGEAPVKDWHQARDDFMRAEQRVDDLLDERRRAHRRLLSIPQSARKVEQLQEFTAHLEETLGTAEHEVAEHRAVVERADAKVAEAKVRHEQQLAARPGGMDALLSFGRATRDWQNGLDARTADLRSAEQRQSEAAENDRQLRAGLDKLRADTDAAAADLSDAQATLAALQAQAALDKTRYGDGYPDEDWVGERREQHSPWLDAELEEARSELFFAALQLHEDFLANTAGTMLDGLRAAGDIVTGAQPPAVPADKLTAAWQLLFLAVPVISTTFGCVRSLFGKAGPEALGWVFVDDGGRVEPSHAVGAIWRAKRAIVVGDALGQGAVAQVPPVASRDIASAFGISETWTPPTASAQSLADRASRHGTFVIRNQKPVWVGIPHAL